MRQSMTIRLEQDVLKVAKVRAKSENRTLTNYIETLIRKDITMSQKMPAQSLSISPRDDAPMTVFLAEPTTERLITDPRDGDTPEDVASRQEYLDIITGWGRGE
ncbi:MAG: hypothetical protein HY985_10745 [Magnetospirillum sp.]|nr:hypothetical protein [Magnetospirillum sp.]